MNKKEDKLVLGVAPTRRKMYDPKFALENKKEVSQKVEELADDNTEIVDIDWLNEEGILIEVEDVKEVAEYFKKQNVDALFMPHCNFGSEEVVGMLGKALDKPFLLWGPRDDSPPEEGKVRQTDTQCGLFASSKALQRYGVPFTYIENCHTCEETFAKEFNNFLKVASVVKTFKDLRIGQVSVRPKPFLTVMVNESELLEKFGIEVVPITGVEITSQVEEILANRKESVQTIIEDIKETLDCSMMEKEEMEKIAALELALMELAQENDCNVMASECWRTFAQSLGIRSCFVFGDVTDRGLPVACETDIHGAVSSVLLQAAARGETLPFLADLTLRHPENDNAELLWHCGPFPKSLAREGSNPFLKDCKGQYELKHGNITIARFDGINNNYNMFAGLARGVEGPSTNGNYVWVEVDDWVKWEKKFIYGPYIHHVAAIHGDYVSVLHEACKYIKDLNVDSV